VRSTLIRLHVEVERSINFYRTQHGGNQPARILLAGGTSVIARTDEFFREKLKIDVEYLNPFRNVVVNDSISAEEVGACAHVMGGVVGMGLRYLLPCPVEINLLPPKLAAAKSFAKKQPFLAAAAAGLVLVALCWWLYFADMGQRLQERRQIVEAKVTELEVVNKRLQSVLTRKKQLLDRLESLQEVVAARTRWLRVLVGVRDCMPDGMWLVSLVPLQSEPVRGQRKTAGFTHLRIRGVIFLDKETDNSVIAFRDRLANAPLFTEKTEIELQPPVAADGYVREFQIMIELKEPLLTALAP
jgi:Tfp pilus assembly protein PilN